MNDFIIKIEVTDGNNIKYEQKITLTEEALKEFNRDMLTDAAMNTFAREIKKI